MTNKVSFNPVLGTVVYVCTELISDTGTEDQVG